MNYPPYPLSKRMKSSILAVFVLGFFIAAPVVTLYATGYRLDRETFQITKTGVLSVDIIPADAQVFLDTTLIATSLPLRLPQMTPGTYHMEIRKDGYMSWTKDIVIEKNKTTYIKNVELFAIGKPMLLQHDTMVIEAIPSKDGNYFLEKILKADENQYEIFDIQKKLSIPVLKSSTQNRTESSWSSKNNFALIEENTSTSTAFHIVDPTKVPSVSDFLIPADHNDIAIQWTENIFNLYRENLLVRDGRYDYILETAGGSAQITTSTVTSTQTYRDARGNDWYVDSTKTYLKKSGNDSIALYAGSTPIEKIIDVNDNRAIVQTANNFVVIEQRDNQLKILPCDNYFFDTVRKEYIAWSMWELWTVYDNGEVALLNRVSEAIHQVRPLDKSGELLIATDHKLLGFNPGYYVTHTLLENVDVETMAVDTKEKVIYFFGMFEGKKGIYSLKY